MDEISKIMNKGLILVSNINQMMENHSDKFYSENIKECLMSFNVVDDYHVWLDEIRKFLSNKLGNNNVNLYYFSKETEKIPTIDYLSKNHLINGDYIQYSFLQDIVNEINKKNSLLIEIYEKNENIFDKNNQPVFFDDENCKLNFMGKDIIISNKQDGDAYMLLKTIFRDKNQYWNIDDIANDWGYDSVKDMPKNKIYQAGMKVNATIAQETTIKDFLDVTTKSVKINEKYL